MVRNSDSIDEPYQYGYQSSKCRKIWRYLVTEFIRGILSADLFDIT